MQNCGDGLDRSAPAPCEYVVVPWQEVGARVLHVLARNAALFQRVLTVGQTLGSDAAVGVLAGASPPGGEERASAMTSRIARGSSAPPTPPPIDEGRSSRRGDGGEKFA